VGANKETLGTFSRATEEAAKLPEGWFFLLLPHRVTKPRTSCQLAISR
jgi:hypothetical protein